MSKNAKSEELIVANKELAYQIAEKERLAAALVIVDEENTKRAADLIIADNEKANLTAELIIADGEKANLTADLAIADVEKMKLTAELIIADAEKAKRAEELVIAIEEKAKRAAELVVANSEKAKRSAELVIAKAEKAKRAAELVIANLEKEKRADELIIAGKELIYQNKEKVKRAAELVIADVNKTKRKAELVIANIEKAKRAAELDIANKELSYQTVEIAKRATELVLADAEKAKRAAEFVIANIEKAKRAAELVMVNVEKAKLTAELVIANQELIYHKNEKAKRAAELIIANVKKAKRPAELIIANIKKAKHAAELVYADRELRLAREKEKLVTELIIINKELAFQIREKEKRENELIALNTVLNRQNKEKAKQAAELIIAKEQAEKCDRLKSSFLTNMSHEIRTPMNGILGFAELLKEPNLSGEEQQEFIRIIELSGARLLNTINNIVDISRIESGLVQIDIKESNINEQIEFIYNFFKPVIESKGIRFSFKNSLSSKNSIIETDMEKIYSILTNLVKNAIKFTDKGSIEYGYEIKGKYLEFFVKDTGIGISKIQQKIIFDRFMQGNELMNRNHEGSGLGLSISKSYVEMLHGKMWVESEEGKGSVFYFTIPYHPKIENKNEIDNIVAPEEKEVHLKKLNILVVEDEEISYFLLSRMLKKYSNKVRHVKTGIEAIESCRNNPNFDLVFMDIRMPDMDGYEATRQIRLFNKELIIIAQTAYGFPYDRQKAIEAGCNDFLSKPIINDELLKLIQKHFKKPGKNKLS